MTYSLLKRPRRNRKSDAIRSLLQETVLTTKDLIAPYFVTEGRQIRAPIVSLPNQFHLSLDYLIEEVESLLESGIQTLILFPLISPKHKDAVASYAVSGENHLLKAVEAIKSRYPEICILADVALDPFTTHGHDGLLSSSGEILNDETVSILAQMSLLYAQAGVDIIAPSDMMDGRILAIRKALDAKGFSNTSLLSYSAKYASCFYGPFRDALQSTPAIGNKKSYQMNPANSQEALREALLDVEEGADILMIKPATFYLDIIQKIKQRCLLPIAAYHVSGEYAMLKAGAEKGWLNFEEALYETLISIKRAGADMIVTYGAKEMATLINTGCF